MKNGFRRLAIFVLLGALCITAWTALGQRQKNSSQLTSAPAWEYKVTPAYLTEDQMNKLGAEGWELAGVLAPNIDNTTLYFKRVKK